MPDSLIVDRGIYDGQGDRAWTKITGFVRTESGLYERFEETAYNTAFDLAWVRDALLQAGWRCVYLCRGDNLNLPVADPEAEEQAFFVAHK